MAAILRAMASISLSTFSKRSIASLRIFSVALELLLSDRLDLLWNGCDVPTSGRTLGRFGSGALHFADLCLDLRSCRTPYSRFSQCANSMSIGEDVPIDKEELSGAFSTSGKTAD